MAILVFIEYSTNLMCPPQGHGTWTQNSAMTSAPYHFKRHIEGKQTLPQAQMRLSTETLANQYALLFIVDGAEGLK